MDAIDFRQGADWTAVAALIQARQRDVAARVTTERAAAEAVQVQGPPQRIAHAGRVYEPERPVRPDGTVTGEAGLGQSATKMQPRPSENETDARGLSEAEKELVSKLKARDAEVRRHEQAHAAVGGQYAGTPSYTYQTGPDGQRYAVGGAVAIDVAPVDGDPEATIKKMEVVKAAALAPAEPSAADRQVAALADAQRAQAVADLASLRQAEREARVDQRI